MGNIFIYPAPKPSYELVKEDPTLLFIGQKAESANCTSFVCAESRKSSIKIPCRYIQAQHSTSPYLIIFFHGNSEDIGSNLSYLLSAISERFAMNVLCPEYPSYGIYKRKDESLRMDEAILEDARRVLKFCKDNMRFKYENIILIGRSLGTGVATQLACEFNVRGIILISPFTSIRNVAKCLVGNILSKVVPDVFRTIDYIDQVQCPTLLIHGEQDALIPHSMSEELYAKATKQKTLRLNKEMTHNQFKIERDVFDPIQNFMMEKLDLSSHIWSITADYLADSYPSFLETHEESNTHDKIKLEAEC